MYSKEGLRLISLITQTQINLVAPIRQNPVFRHWRGSTTLFHYKGDTQQFSTAITAYKNGCKRGK